MTLVAIKVLDQVDYVKRPGVPVGPTPAECTQPAQLVLFTGGTKTFVPEALVFRLCPLQPPNNHSDLETPWLPHILPNSCKSLMISEMKYYENFNQILGRSELILSPRWTAKPQGLIVRPSLAGLPR